MKPKVHTPNVLHHGEVIFRHAEGLADVAAGLAANSDTVYAIASCSKAFTTAAVAGLVADGKLDWDAPLSSYLPDFAHTPHDPEVGRRVTLRDACSHGTGLAPLDHAVMGFHDEWYIKGEDGVRAAANLPVAYDFRSRFLYNNAVIGAVGDVLSAVTGRSFRQVLRERIFDPLGLRSTFTATAEYVPGPDGAAPNAAKGYTKLDDGTLVERGYLGFEPGDSQFAAGGIRSSVNDMLVWAAAVLDAQAAAAVGRDRDQHPALRGVEETRAAQRPITFENSAGENSYGMGWFRHTLPTRWLGSIGPNYNGRLFRHPPRINADGPPRAVIAHWGELQGFLAAFYTFPDTASAVVVLANGTMSHGDPTDLLAQLIVQELFDMSPRVHLVDFAREAAATALQVWPNLVRDWEKARTADTSPGPLSDYVGAFRNPGLMLTLEVFALPDHAQRVVAAPDRGRELLAFRVNGLARQVARLRHYHYDVWTFLPNSRDDALAKGLELYLKLEYLLLSFKRGRDGAVDAVEWDLQGAGDCEGPAPGLAELVKPIRFEKVKEE